tara:strand:+ start:119 stop:658 length:540 start_codon:yes stop_codon:yes gene_type:complete
MIRLKQLLKEQQILNDQFSTREKLEIKRIKNVMKDWSKFIKVSPPIVNKVDRQGVRIPVFEGSGSYLQTMYGYAFGSIIGCIINAKHYQWDLSGVPGFRTLGTGPEEYQFGKILMSKNSDLHNQAIKDASSEGYAIGWQSEIMNRTVANGWWVYAINTISQHGEFKSAKEKLKYLPFDM